ncbi:GNAT family N-acetyltransferase [Nocardia sp. NPDC047038]|uniref:GNAT family N-acetyltransferase n=1 Tax=Nocardia sp. NPDC047038 TaxID=3154338 RepID=UPI0033C42AE4
MSDNPDVSALMPDVVAAEVFAAGTQPALRGETVLLRPWTNADAAVIRAVYQDPDIQRWHVRDVVSEAEARELIARWQAGWSNGDGPQWAVVVGDVVAGRVGLRHMAPADGVAGIAYWTAPGWRGRGVTPAAVETVTRWAFEVGFHRLEVSHSVRNAASCRAAVKAGFAPEGVRRSAGLHADGWHDMHLHARLRPA